MKKAAEAPLPEAAEALPVGPLLPLPTPPPLHKNKKTKGGRKSPTDVSAPSMTKVKADEIKNVGSQEQPGDSGVAENPVRDEDDGYFQTTDAPVYRKVAQRIVVGIKPLIVRIGSSVDSELTGLISPGSKLQVVETRQEGNCLRALVLIDQANAEHPLSPRTPGTARGLPSSPRTRSPFVRPAMPPESWVEIGEWPEPLNKAPPPANFEESLVLLIDQACGNTAPIQKQNPVAFQRKREVGMKASELIGKAGSRDSLRPLLSALIDDVMACTHGWVTSAREGQELLTRVHEGVNAGSRQQHITLWDRRKAADKLNLKQVISGGSAKDSKDRMLAGPSFSHELAADPSGIGVWQRVSNSRESLWIRRFSDSPFAIRLHVALLILTTECLHPHPAVRIRRCRPRRPTCTWAGHQDAQRALLSRSCWALPAPRRAAPAGSRTARLAIPAYGDPQPRARALFQPSC